MSACRFTPASAPVRRVLYCRPRLSFFSQKSSSLSHNHVRWFLHTFSTAWQSPISSACCSSLSGRSKRCMVCLGCNGQRSHFHSCDAVHFPRVGGSSIKYKNPQKNVGTTPKSDSSSSDGSAAVNYLYGDSLMAEILAKDLANEGELDKPDGVAKSPKPSPTFKLNESDLKMYMGSPEVKYSDQSFEEVEEASDIDYTESDPTGDYEEVVVDTPLGRRVTTQGEDPSIPVSDTPCAGCGALLHCQDMQLPGYMPSERYTRIPRRKLRESMCTRCIKLAKHNQALAVNVTPQDYVNLITKIRDIHALCLLIVDVTDIENSFIRNLPSLIGKKRPLYVIGNKVDVLPCDSDSYLKTVEKRLKTVMEEEGLFSKMHVKHVGLISAKTGYGVEELVTRLMTEWERKGHLYILGSTNCGKSSLFNSLLCSDYCKDSARDYISRATISNWPGTTLGLLKFPIINPVPWRLQQRKQRLLKERPDWVEAELVRKEKYHDTKNLKYATLIGNVGQTFLGTASKTIEEQSAAFAGFKSATFGYKAGAVHEMAADQTRLRERVAGEAGVEQYNENMFRKANWCHDTPGIVHGSQILNKLTKDELDLLVGHRLHFPRTFSLKPGGVMFLSGLGRIDYVQGNTSVYMTVISAPKIPVHIMDKRVADDFYREHIGTQTFKLPSGDSDRLAKIPSLIGKEVTLYGAGWNVSKADIQLSSLGWVSVTAGKGMRVTLRAYTPGGEGCVVRSPPLLPFAVELRGKRVRGTPEFKVPVKTKLGR